MFYFIKILKVERYTIVVRRIQASKNKNKSKGEKERRKEAMYIELYNTFSGFISGKHYNDYRNAKKLRKWKFT